MPVDRVDLGVADAQPAAELVGHRGRHRRRRPRPHHLPEAPPGDLGLDGFEQVVGVVGQLHVGVARCDRELKKFELRRSTLDAASRYWHFVDVLWVYLLFLL